MLAVLLVSSQAFSVISAWMVGVVLLSFCYAVVRLAERRGWRFVGGIVPAVAIAVMLGFYEPFCEGWWYYSNMLCWAI